MGLPAGGAARPSLALNGLINGPAGSAGALRHLGYPYQLVRTDVEDLEPVDGLDSLDGGQNGVEHRWSLRVEVGEGQRTLCRQRGVSATSREERVQTLVSSALRGSSAESCTQPTAASTAYRCDDHAAEK